MPVVLYGCETWSLTMREERTVRFFENRVKVNQSHYRPEVPTGFQEVKVSRLRDNGTG